MTKLSHPYSRFRIRLAHRALLQFADSLKNSLEILLVIAGPALLGLVAVIALPGLYAATQPWPACAGMILAQALLTALPAWLLRKRLLPADIALWQTALPLPPALRWTADLAVAGILSGPLALAYIISLAVWLWQWPAWLRPVASLGIAATVLALLLSWAISAMILAARARPAAPTRQRRQLPPASAYLARRRLPRGLFLWHRLFWLPFWRGDNPVGLQQSLLLLGATAAAVLWLWHPAPLPAAVSGAAASALLVLLTDRGEKAVHEHIALLRPLIAGWPLTARPLEWGARLFCLAPALAVLLLLGAALAAIHDGYSHRVAALYLGTCAAAQCAIVGVPGLSPRSRVALVFLSILLLTAIGSELWN
ncbi:hypothetical protein AAKU55_000662 [Oxalobacteraceae bacterium GrIS 1.11]